MISVKHGVQLYGSRPEISFTRDIVREIFERNNTPCALTSSRDGHRGSPSLHNCGTDEQPVSFADDYRSIHITDLAIKNRILDQLKLAMPFCDVLLHSVNGGAEHYHIEFDPKDDPLFQAKKAAWKRGEKVNW